jgi:hypothetical protein
LLDLLRRLKSDHGRAEHSLVDPDASAARWPVAASRDPALAGGTAPRRRPCDLSPAGMAAAITRLDEDRGICFVSSDNEAGTLFSADGSDCAVGDVGAAPKAKKGEVRLKQNCTRSGAVWLRKGSRHVPRS